MPIKETTPDPFAVRIERGRRAFWSAFWWNAAMWTLLGALFAHTCMRPAYALTACDAVPRPLHSAGSTG